MLAFVGLCALYITMEIVLPAKRYLRNGLLKSSKGILIMLFRIIPVVILILSSYVILFSKNYSLRYTYWIAFILFILELAIIIIRWTISDYNKSKSENKKHKWFPSIVLVVFWVLIVSLQTNNVIDLYLQPKRQIVLENLKTPETIEIYKHNKDNTSIDFLSRKSSGEITSADDITKIISELKSMKIVNITTTDLINYYRMKKDNYPYFTIEFIYNNNISKIRNLENGYMEEIILTSNRNTVIKESNSRKSLITTKWYDEIYPINLSEEAMNIILNSLEKRDGQ